MEGLAEQIKAGQMDFDIVIASPDTMRIVGTLGQGARGLMPNPKVGTVTPDVATAVKNAKAGQVQFRVDKAGIIHATIGRASFEPTALRSNLSALIEALQKQKRQRARVYLRKIRTVEHDGRRRACRPATLAHSKRVFGPLRSRSGLHGLWAVVRAVGTGNRLSKDRWWGAAVR